jgi:hypothetical protein
MFICTLIERKKKEQIMEIASTRRQNLDYLSSQRSVEGVGKGKKNSVPGRKKKKKNSIKIVALICKMKQLPIVLSFFSGQLI